MSLAQDKEAPEFLAAAGSPQKTTLTFNFSEKESITSKVPSIDELSARITSLGITLCLERESKRKGRYFSSLKTGIITDTLVFVKKITSKNKKAKQTKNKKIKFKM